MDFGIFGGGIPGFTADANTQAGEAIRTPALVRPISLIHPYYDNPTMLKVQLDHWAGIPTNLRPFVQILLCDDCSPEHPAIEVIQDWWESHKDTGVDSSNPMPFSLFRVDVDVRWNWIAARNICIEHAKTDWFFMSDIDHMLPYETLEALISNVFKYGTAWKFNRVDARLVGVEGNYVTVPAKNPHPNTWFMQRDTFYGAGGYDERWSGHYGSDGEFRDRVTKYAREVGVLPYTVIRVEKDVIPDSETLRYERKTAEDAAFKATMREMMKKDPVPKRLTFPYTRII